MGEDTKRILGVKGRVLSDHSKEKYTKSNNFYEKLENFSCLPNPNNVVSIDSGSLNEYQITENTIFMKIL